MFIMIPINHYFKKKLQKVKQNRLKYNKYAVWIKKLYHIKQKNNKNVFFSPINQMI